VPYEPTQHKQLKNEMAIKLKGTTDVQLKTGRGDIVTETHIYEVKYINHWKQAIGQVLVYSVEMNKKPALILFGTRPDDDKLTLIEQICKALNVETLYRFQK
jgi:L-alanine-DL-glutamate epimerase-like enolase superfamily enzyme